MPIAHPDEPLMLYSSPSAGVATTNATGSANWSPYSGTGDFGASIAIILAAILCIILLALSLGAVVRFLLIGRRHSEDPAEPEPEPPPSGPTVLFSSAETLLAGTAVECTICLTEFTEGDAVRVLPACNHGFHVRCVERWLAARSSCPTCRRACDGANAVVQGGKGRGPSEHVEVEVPVEGLN